MSFGTKLTTSELKDLVGGNFDGPGPGCKCTCNNADYVWIQYYVDCMHANIEISAPVCGEYGSFNQFTNTATCVRAV